MVELETFIPFIWLIIPCVTVAVFYKIRTNYKIQQLKTEGKIKQKEETIAGSINKFLNDAPSQLKTIESEIATLQAKAIKEHLTPEQTKSLLQRLSSERDMLVYAVKYGDMAKPFVKPVDKIVNKLLGGFMGNG